MKTPLFALTTALVFAAVAPAALSAVSNDEAAIRQECAKFVSAWNIHDAKAMAAVWAEDGDLINPFGRVAKGRAEIEELFAGEQAGVMKGTTYSTTAVSVRLLSPTVAISDWSAEVAGMRDPKGAEMPVFKHHVVAILEKRNGSWVTTIVRAYAYLPVPPPPAPPAL